MDTITFSFSVLSFLLLSSSFLHSSLSVFSAELPRSEREALQCIDGEAGDNAPAPSPDGGDNPPLTNCGYNPSPPPPLLSLRLLKARLVLLQFAATIDDPTGFTKNWKEDVSPCDFRGVRCDKYPNTEELAVSGIDFNQAGFSPRPGSILDLTLILGIPELTFFHVNSNNFTGSVPTEIIKYPFFFELDLSNNKLEGHFPWQVLFAVQLTFLDLRFNSLIGPVPPSLFFLDLDVIFINNNNFFGYLPWTFGFTRARYLTFANNKFIGPIPRSIGLASKTLTEVLFLGNQFSGCLPFEIGFLKNAVVFDVSKNSLTGPIPESFACLEKIRFLNLANNRFYGAVPESVCKLPGIQTDGNFSLAGNYFSKVGPECVKLIKSKVLDVSQNCIKDLPNQRSPEECEKFLSCLKPCPNARSLTYVPCKKYDYSKYVDTASSPPAPVTYEALKPTRHRLM
ncbi:hypothetical protein QN277_001373 [Acacia crassicarpa]|uniref:Cell wall hydroxyproline-rich glycoprotein n=1 Tax=Acacia crassicarpa TaxID=499986 RepID=A0AAE1TH00_9FABA|nr:hypothetical protein QN277_001373 [Acacia crassicarpa]